MIVLFLVNAFRAQTTSKLRCEGGDAWGSSAAALEPAAGPAAGPGHGAHRLEGLGGVAEAAAGRLEVACTSERAVWSALACASRARPRRLGARGLGAGRTGVREVAPADGVGALLTAEEADATDLAEHLGGGHKARLLDAAHLRARAIRTSASDENSQK